jgi:uncharacterized protein YdbL (DUF1318 family)
MNGIAKRLSLAMVAGLLLAAGGSVAVVMQPAWAVDIATAKATTDAAKAAGTVGEQGDGYLGFVKGSADAATTEAVNAINSARKQAFAAAAAKTGVTPEAAGEAIAKQQYERMPAGQYFKPIGGGWVKK